MHCELTVDLFKTLPFLRTTVEIRGTQDKVRADGGQRGTIYNQRHLSPHRMMHFGKRPASLPPPLITTPQVFDLYQDRPLQLDESSSNSRYPYLLYLELERGKTLRSLPEGKPFFLIMFFSILLFQPSTLCLAGK